MQNLFNQSRRSSIRRQGERRENELAYGSPEWIAKMREGYVLWPKQDNRRSDRRSAERRSNDRRADIRSAKLARQKRSAFFQESTNDILDYNEKQFIMNLFNEEV